MNVRNAFAALLLLAASTISAETADVALVMNHDPGPVPIRGGGEMTLYFGMRNTGPDVARDVTVTIHIPDGMIVDRIYGDDSTCDYGTIPLRCHTPDLAPNGLTTNYWEVRGRARSGAVQEMTLAASVASSAADPNAANNSVGILYQVGETVDLHVEAQPNYVRVSRNDTFVSRISIANFGAPVEARDLTLRLDVQNGTIEAVEAPEGWTCSRDAQGATCTAARLDPDCACARDFLVTTRTHDRTTGGNVVLRARASTPQQEWTLENNVRLVLAEVYREILVTSAADGGAGSLRAALEEANANCSPGPCRIAFAIPAGASTTIAPRTPLPAVLAARVFLDGTTQESIAIDGRAANGPGLVFRTACEAIVEGLSLSNFSDHAIVFSATAPCSRSALDQRRIANNLLENNLRGILLDETSARVEKNVIRGHQLSGIFTAGQSALFAYENTIERNGRSGIYLSPRTTFAEIFRNIIAENAEMGVAAAIGARQIDIRENSMRANGGLGIDWNLDGISPIRDDDAEWPSNAPVLFSAIYDAKREMTIITGRVRTSPLGPYINAVNVDLYANATPDGDGERWLQPGGVQSDGTFLFQIKGDLRGQWINATATRTHWFAGQPPSDRMVSHALAGGASMTSELSNAVRVD